MKVSRCTSVVSGKSLACFFWKGSASFFKSIADYSLGRVIGLIFNCGARKWSISDGRIGLADGSDELAVLGKSVKHDCGSHFAH